MTKTKQSYLLQSLKEMEGGAKWAKPGGGGRVTAKSEEGPPDVVLSGDSHWSQHVAL